jgi:hypothetical protein
MIKLKINQFEVSGIGYPAHSSLFLWLWSGVVAPHQTLQVSFRAAAANTLDFWTFEKATLPQGWKSPTNRILDLCWLLRILISRAQRKRNRARNLDYTMCTRLRCFLVTTNCWFRHITLCSPKRETPLALSLASGSRNFSRNKASNEVGVDIPFMQVLSTFSS